jgi:putative transposase
MALHPFPGKQTHAFALGQRREIVAKVAALHNISIAPACRAVGVSETCYRYGPKLKAEKEEVPNLLVKLTDARKSWGVGLYFLHQRGVKGHC